MADQLNELCSNLNSKIVSADLEHLDDSLIKRLKSNFIPYKTHDYLKNIDFVKNPISHIPNIKKIVIKYKEQYDSETYDIIMNSLDVFENEIRFALENRHKEVYMAPDMTPEKVTQIIGNHYKETLSQI